LAAEQTPGVGKQYGQHGRPHDWPQSKPRRGLRYKAQRTARLAAERAA